MANHREQSVDDSLLCRAAECIAQGTGLLVLAGAGIGVDSGLPDFRGDEGFWRAYPALRGSAIRLGDIANPRSFVDDPALAWGFYGHRLRMYRETAPHAGFAILNRWCESMPDGWWVSTTNVDGHFQKAGFTAKYVHEFHGSIHDLQCTKPCDAGTWPATKLQPVVDGKLRWVGNLPLCRRCSDIARPNILMFDDAQWVGGQSGAKYRELVEWLDAVQRLVIVEVGAGTAIPTLRVFGDRLVRHRSAKRIRINLRDSDVGDQGSIGIAAEALGALSAIDLRMQGPLRGARAEVERFPTR